MIAIIVSVVSCIVAIVSATAAGVWAVSQRQIIRREDLDKILEPITLRLEKLTDKFSEFAADYVKRDEFNHTIDGLRQKIVGHLSNGDIHVNSHEKVVQKVD